MVRFGEYAHTQTTLTYFCPGRPDEFVKKSPRMYPNPCFCQNQLIILAWKKYLRNGLLWKFQKSPKVSIGENSLNLIDRFCHDTRQNSRTNLFPHLQDLKCMYICAYIHIRDLSILFGSGEELRENKRKTKRSPVLSPALHRCTFLLIYWLHELQCKIKLVLHAYLQNQVPTQVAESVRNTVQS
jgi:hypothetical protein